MADAFDKTYGAIAYNGITLADGTSYTFSDSSAVRKWISNHGDFPKDAVIGGGFGTYGETIDRFHQAEASTETQKNADPAVFKLEDTYKPRVVGASASQNKSQDDSAIPNNTSGAKNNTTGETSQRANDFSSPSMRQTNPLSEFSSSTYKISLYSITPEAYNSYYQEGQWQKKDLHLIVQSGGILNTNDSKLESKRAKGFELDYFIDNLVIDTATAGAETQGVSNQLNFSFQVFEPYGITFPTKLVQNQVYIQQLSSMKREIKQQIEALQGHLLLTVRFYGYDENGELIDSKKYNAGDYSRTDEQAAFERSFPIVITKFNFSISNKVTVYDINAKLINEQVSTGIKRGTMPVNVEITAETVAEAIGGPEVDSTNGLLDQLNKLQKKSVADGKQEIADIYDVKFDDNGLETALIVDKNLNKDKTPMVQVNGSGQVNDRTANAAKAQVVRRKRTITFGNGISIIQAMDQILSQSSYITDALTFKDSEEAETVTEGEDGYEKNEEPKTLAWYIIVPHTEINGYDTIRNDYAYKITYVIKRYEVPYVRSLSHKYVPKYYGPHKRYNYWYTGKNTEVLSYEQTYNLLYFNASALSSESATTNKKDAAPNQPMPAQNADPTSVMAKAFEASNSVKTFLYSPGDQLKAKITVLGDPDFLMPATAGTVSEILKKWYGPDFTVNPNSGQVFIEIVFQQVEDYDDAGVLKPNNNITFWDYPKDVQTFVKGMVYMVTKVTSKFSKGKFTQEFKTAIPNFNDMQVAGTASSQTSTKPQTVASQTPTRDEQSNKEPTAEDLRIKDEALKQQVVDIDKKYPTPAKPDDDADPASATAGSKIIKAGSSDGGREDSALSKIFKFR